jgi:hypothetical protein
VRLTLGVEYAEVGTKELTGESPLPELGEISLEVAVDSILPLPTAVAEKSFCPRGFSASGIEVGESKVQSCELGLKRTLLDALD